MGAGVNPTINAAFMQVSPYWGGGGGGGGGRQSQA